MDTRNVCREVVTDSIGLLTLIAGLAILFVSILRERLYFWRRDRYKDVRR